MSSKPKAGIAVYNAYNTIYKIIHEPKNTSLKKSEYNFSDTFGHMNASLMIVSHDKPTAVYCKKPFYLIANLVYNVI